MKNKTKRKGMFIFHASCLFEHTVLSIELCRGDCISRKDANLIGNIRYKVYKGVQRGTQG